MKLPRRRDCPSRSVRPKRGKGQFPKDGMGGIKIWLNPGTHYSSWPSNLQCLICVEGLRERLTH